MKKISLLVILMLSTFLIALSQSALALQSGTTEALLTHFPIAGKPLNLVVESAERLWFTMPDENAIGSLTFDTDGAATFTTYPALTANSEPYDLVYDADNQLIWFSQRMVNRIGRLDISTGVVTEPVVLAADSQPAGIALAPNGFLWFVEKGANKLASYDPASKKVQEHDYAPYNISGNAELEDVAVQNNDSIWFTAPKDSEVVRFVPSSGLYFRSFFKSQLGTEEPFSIALDTNGRAWVTDIGSNRVAAYSPGTLTFWARYAINSDASTPVGIALDTHSGSSSVVFTQSGSSRLARLSTHSDTATKPLELPLAEASKPWGIAVGEDGTIWVADSGTSTITRWNRPFFHIIYLPFVQ